MQEFFSGDWLTIDIISPVIFIWILFFIFIYAWIRQNKIRKLKFEGIWMLKKTKIFKIWSHYHAWDTWYSEYWLLSKDESWTVYKSGSFKNLEYGWRSIHDMKRIYNWIEYDLSNKDIATRQVNDRISFLESEIVNDPWLFKKMDLNFELKTMKEYLDIINEWLINPYVVINKHKVSGWDYIDVYVDPMNLDNYYFDLDFTKEKI